MNENGSKRREWVKSAAIVFLSVLLVLTFFSNTIMNYSLPEVATQYVESGTITAKIRGSGVVEGGDPYSVKLKTNTDTNATGIYTVQSVEVRKGDKVEKGDLLCQLEGSESKPLQEAKDALNSKLLEYEIAIIRGEVSESVLSHAQSGKVSSLNAYQSRLLAKEKEIQALKDEVKEAENTLAAWETQKGVVVDTQDEKEALDKAQADYDAVKKVIDAADVTINDWQKMIDQYQATINSYGLIEVSGGDSIVTPAQVVAAEGNIALLKQKIADKNNEAALVAARAKLPELKEALEKAQKEYDEKPKDNVNTADDNIRKWNKEVADLKQKVTDAEKEKDKLIADAVKELEWNDQLSELREKIDKLQQEVVGEDVTAPIAGTISDIYVKSGEDTPGNGVLFTIQPEGKGYLLKFSVTNEQAKRLSVGDKADLVNAWRYDDVNVQLASIRPDTQNPGQNKQLTFDVTGNVTPGQSLNVSVGQKSANYDLTVPNSAIREDNNGKFILIVETKSSPLNNRYVATRVDVEVLASDDTRSAINAPLYGYEYVITTSTAPVEAGKLIRLANNN